MPVWFSLPANQMRYVIALYVGVLCLLLTGITGVVGVAVFYRYALGQPLAFSFDLAGLLFAWLIFLGLPLASAEKANLKLDFTLDQLPSWLGRWIEVTARVATISAVAYFAWFGAELAMLTTQELPAMRISMTWLYASLPAGALLVILYEIYDLVGFLRRQHDRVTGGI